MDLPGKTPHFLSRLCVRLPILVIVAMLPAVLLALFMAAQAYLQFSLPGELANMGGSHGIAVALGGLAAAFLAALSLSWAGANVLITRPLGALVAAARRLGGGEYGARCGLKHSAGEIGSLAAAFDDMADKLEARQSILNEMGKELGRSEARFRGLAENMSSGIFAHRGEKTLYANRYAEVLTGFTREEILAMHFTEILHPDFRELARERSLARLSGNGAPGRYELRLNTRDGRECWVELTAGTIDFEGQRTVMGTFTEVTERRAAEEALRRARDELEQQVTRRTAQLSDALQELEGDVARRKRTEAELLARNAELNELNRKLGEAQTQLMQSEKLASIGQLAAGVAHEINNPIGYVQSNLGSLEHYLKDLFEMLDGYEKAEAALPADAAAHVRALREQLDLAFLREDVPNLMNESKEGITRVRKIVHDLKDFSRADSGVEWEFADLHKCLDSTLNVVHNEIKYKADVIREYGALPEVECLPSQLNQVFMNLMVNAAHAMDGPRGTITLRTGTADEEAWVEVADTGKGIPPENLGRIFDPFFTTKPVGKGTGLGLSLAYGIVQKHHGRIEVTSELGRGTTFRVTVPAKRRETAEAA